MGKSKSDSSPVSPLVLPAAAGVSDILDRIIGYAIRQGASDIHIDPQNGFLAVRLRIDGILSHCATLSPSIHNELIARIKVLSRLRPDIHLLAQDGRFSHQVWHGGSVDMRVSVVPTHFGENAVIRVLSDHGHKADFASLGFSIEAEGCILDNLERTQGLILVTGPTGSGKTSTMYAMLRHLSQKSLSIVTLEDPIEYAMPGIRQVAVDHRHGITFSNGLRSLVRQDPDVILVGEIRDRETAQAATNIALTGHLVISTLHTTDAIGAVARLEDLGIEPYLVAHTLVVVIAQRLVRTLCHECGGENGGCASCLYRGFKGRTAISEILEVDEEIRAYLSARLPAADIMRHARARGMVPMRDNALEKVDWGVTTAAEVRRVLDL